MQFTSEQINEVCECKHITASGYLGKPGIHNTLSHEFHRQVEIAVIWLQDAPIIKTITVSSYASKHICETLANTYVSNGALLVAVNLLGIPHRKEGLNARLPISRSWYKKQMSIAYQSTAKP